MKYAVRLSDDQIMDLRNLLEDHDDETLMDVLDALESDLDGEIELKGEQLRRLIEVVEESDGDEREDVLQALRNAYLAESPVRRLRG